ncbi:hypothetical protein TRFO_07495 [Tritrichomonas foetus]|uniref:Nucleotide-diphospho-sugar transferase domain-containing protein n=1 Tax=Tritrichomonas foetus TaxID=1144522 RepID=A0A1J4JRE2_9EUKA|nr:hypothetical protein TRFO_07495 [Tritrichomonas foetus]|eukprot:OHT01595.1 hypothetical protein TRFO_07495 [Tritrichomonas foetus]
METSLKQVIMNNGQLVTKIHLSISPKIMKITKKSQNNFSLQIGLYLLLVFLYLLVFLIFPYALQFVRYILHSSNNSQIGQKTASRRLKTQIYNKTSKNFEPDARKLYSDDSSENADFSQVCKPKFRGNLPPASSTNDVILLYATKFTPGLHLALRSYQASQCKARIIIFVSGQFKGSRKDMNFLNEINATIVDQCTEDPSISSAPVPHMLRFKCELEWLNENIDSGIDRVLHTDSYDIFFQSDPFIPEMIQNDSLTFVVEPHFIRGCGWNLNWFTSCYGETITPSFIDNFIVCSGTIAGSAKHYQTLLKLMLEQPQWKTCYTHSRDQPILNYLIWSGKVDERGIKYRFSGCDGGFATLQWCILNYEVKYNKMGQVVLPSGIVPAYIHQYPRHESLKNHLYQACGIH